MQDALQAKADRFFDLAAGEVEVRPWLVVILMHEYYRNLYPTDPHLPFAAGSSHRVRIEGVLDDAIRGLEAFQFAGSYFAGHPEWRTSVLAGLRSRSVAREKEGETQQVYGQLWDRFDEREYVEQSYRVLAERFAGSVFDLSSVAGKTVLDMGCGSGRYSIALARAGAARVVGVDLGSRSIELARAVAERAGLVNLEFSVGSVLDLGFDDGAFDFVFCNGVLHHTTDMEGGIRELYRVLKQGGEAFLYLYADGGLFWYSRKRMPAIMKRIPQEYTMAVLDLIGLPSNRFLFVDNWYVPIERHTSRAALESYLAEVGFAPMVKIQSGRPTDLDSRECAAQPDSQALWGDGEHRYLLGKSVVGGRA
jgi:ubiquinone/menaquinone biosynthesis C-methylase UbiE